ncbi:MAG: glycosyltransferase, partial [Pseudomonas sp.]
METQPQDNPDNSPAPLVSVLVRSMNRPELREALQSIEQQTWPNIEIVLVDASGKGLSCHKDLTLRTPLREISDGIPRNRPAAANEALCKARGEFMLFLDEDDWIAPEHISNLARCLTDNGDIAVAYSATQLITPAGKAQGEPLRIEFDPARLQRDNFIPIHSALFRRSAVSAGGHFDENLEIFEDWDFWLQLSRLGSFTHVNEVTAFYRQGGGSNTASQPPATRYQQGHPIATARAKV